MVAEINQQTSSRGIRVVDLTDWCGNPDPIWFAYLPGAGALKLLYSKLQACVHPCLQTSV
jgi:hypothetical protein